MDYYKTPKAVGASKVKKYMAKNYTLLVTEEEHNARKITLTHPILKSIKSIDDFVSTNKHCLVKTNDKDKDITDSREYILE